MTGRDVRCTAYGLMCNMGTKESFCGSHWSVSSRETNLGSCVLCLTLVQDIILNLLFHWVSFVFAPSGLQTYSRSLHAVQICFRTSFSRFKKWDLYNEVDQYHWYFVSPMPYPWMVSHAQLIQLENVIGLNAPYTLWSTLYSLRFYLQVVLDLS